MMPPLVIRVIRLQARWRQEAFPECRKAHLRAWYKRLGIILLSAVHGADRAPSLIIALIFGLVTFEGAFAMFTNILVEYSLGALGWIAIFGGSLLATALAFALLSRTHPLATRLRQAEEER